MSRWKQVRTAAVGGAAVAAVWAVVAFGLGRAHERMAADGRRA